MKDYDIFKKGFGHQINMEGDNPAAEIHHHDYYELVFFLGDEPIEYYYEGKYYTLRKGELLFAECFRITDLEDRKKPVLKGSALV